MTLNRKFRRQTANRHSDCHSDEIAGKTLPCWLALLDAKEQARATDDVLQVRHAHGASGFRRAIGAQCTVTHSGELRDEMGGGMLHPMKLRLVVEHDPETNRWSAHFPELPGCASAGDTAEEAVANAKEALELWFEPSPVFKLAL